MSNCQCQCQCQRIMSMSKTFIGGAVCREFESEAPMVGEMLDRVARMQQRTVQFS